jgi:hypothetical protein
MPSSSSSRYAASWLARLRALCSLRFERWVSVAAASTSAASIVSFGALRSSCRLWAGVGLVEGAYPDADCDGLHGLVDSCDRVFCELIQGSESRRLTSLLAA